MKKRLYTAVVVLLTLLLLSACTKGNKGDDVTEYNLHNYFDYDTTSPGVYMGDVCPDEKSAIDLATAIYNNIPKSSAAEKYTPQHAFFDEQNDVWVVLFQEKTDRYVAGGGCSIVLQKKDGKVLQIRFGE